LEAGELLDYLAAMLEPRLQGTNVTAAPDLKIAGVVIHGPFRPSTVCYVDERIISPTTTFALDELE